MPARSFPWKITMKPGLFCMITVACACSSASPAAPPPAPSAFEKLTLDSAYRSEGVAVFDVDKDGHLNVVTEPAPSGPSPTTSSTARHHRHLFVFRRR
jgi:hypothetical protein